MKFLLVGTGFVEGAGQRLKELANGAEVTLRAEPENPWDSEAVRVEAAFGGRETGARPRSLGGDRYLLGHLGATEDSKAAKRARAEGIEFNLAKAWHEGKPETGKLRFCSDGSVIVETEEERSQ